MKEGGALYVERLLAFDREASERGAQAFDDIMLDQTEFLETLCPHGQKAFRRLIQRTIDSAHKYVFQRCSLEPQEMEWRDGQFIYEMHWELYAAEHDHPEVPHCVFERLREVFDYEKDESEDEPQRWAHEQVDDMEPTKKSQIKERPRTKLRNVQRRKVRQVRQRLLGQLNKAVASLVDTPQFRDVCRTAATGVRKMVDRALREVRASQSLDKAVRDALAKELTQPHDIATTFLLRCLLE